MKTKIITLVLLCMCALCCHAQLHNNRCASANEQALRAQPSGHLYFIPNKYCPLYNIASLSKAVIDVCGEDFLKEALKMKRFNCVGFNVCRDSLGNVMDVSVRSNRIGIDIDDDDLAHIKNYLISNNMKFALCLVAVEEPNGIAFLCSDSGYNDYMGKETYEIYKSVHLAFPGCFEIYKCDSTERLARYYEWLDKYTYPNCLPMCEPCGCNPMSEMTNDYIFQQLSIGDIMSYQLLNEYVQQTEEVKLKFLYELSHPQHCDTTIIERCANSIKESLVLSDFEKQRMLKALLGRLPRQNESIIVNFNLNEDVATIKNLSNKTSK